METEAVYVCQQCPFGCVLKVRCDADGNFIDVSGNTCERGEQYARLRTEGHTDDEIRELTGSGHAKESAQDETSNTADDSKPKRPARYSAYRKRKKQN